MVVSGHHGSALLCCHTQVWVDARLQPDGSVELRAGSDSAITAGLAGLLVFSLSGATPSDILSLDPAAVLPRLGLGPAVLTPSRTHGLANLMEAIQRRTRKLVQELPQFPSLVISADAVEPQGMFAEVQAQYLTPDPQQVQQLVELLSSKKIGVVAHFYMDPQVGLTGRGPILGNQGGGGGVQGGADEVEVKTPAAAPKAAAYVMLALFWGDVVERTEVG